MARAKKEKKASMARDASRNPWIVFYKKYYSENKTKFTQVTQACKQAAEEYKKLSSEEKKQLISA
jgi:hypothetical protein